MPTDSAYRLVQLPNGARSVRSVAHGETFHPVIGPAAEAEALYVRQLRIPERLADLRGEFVIWDVGLGAAANVLTVLRAVRHLAGPLVIISFDHTLEPLQFAAQHASALGYVADFENAVNLLIQQREMEFQEQALAVRWQVQLGDFPTLLASEESRQWPKPHAILFDPFSPARNPAMWTLPLFARIYRLLAADRPCGLATYSRSTLLRVTLLLAGFFVGSGQATGEKEETTVAANVLDLVPRPLDRHWLAGLRRSTSAEPLREPVYRQAPLRLDTWEELHNHPQFR